MAERKATNKYYPPEWTPDQGSLNTFHGSHPLRDRARKLHQGIMIMRFELPFNIWCNGCGNHIGMGVRYNAEKTRVGHYYTTPIFKFRMRCQYCANYFEIQTDPKNFEYVVVSGASRKNEQWEHVEGESVAIAGKEEASKLATDAMYRLEHSAEDEKKSEDSAPRIAKLLDLQGSMKDDFTLNQILRKDFREKKAMIKAEEEKDKDIQRRASLSIPLVPEKAADIVTAKKIMFASTGSRSTQEKERLLVKSQPIFKRSMDSPEHKRAKMALLKTCMKDKTHAVVTGTAVKDTQSMLGIRRKAE